LEAIPGIDEGIVSQIQGSVVSFYEYDSGQAAQEAAPVEPEEIETVIDEESQPTPDHSEPTRDREGAAGSQPTRDREETAGISQREHDADLEGGPAEEDAFENIETGVLERDIATHEAALLEETEEGEVLDLGRVEGLSAAPSVLRNMVVSTEDAEQAESDTIKKPE
jgi:hypothetical protein